MKTIWIALSFVAACTGIILGTSLRSRQESGSSLFSTSELLALKSGSSNSSDEAPWFPATAYYDQVRRIVEAEYVVPITDKSEMARSSLRYLLRSLGDPETRYYDPEQWHSYTGRLQGIFEGIGADLLAQEQMSPTGAILPLNVMSVAPGGPADRAGLVSGDVIESIDGRWIASRSLFEELQRASDQFTAGKLSRKRYDEIWQGVRDKSERMMSVDEAVNQLQTGSGTVQLEVRRGAKTLKFTVQRMITEVAPVTFDGQTIKVHHFGPGSGDEIAEYISEDRSAVIDLRGNPGGSMEEVEVALAAIVGGGVYAQVRNDPSGPLEKLSIDTSKQKRPTITYTVLVDGGTAREAEVFAAALRDRGVAKIEGPLMAGLARRVQRYSLPDGSGYSITSGHYHDLMGKSLVREDERVKKARQDAMEVVR